MSNTSPNASVTLAEVIEVARRSRGLLAPETAGYLVLGAADQLVDSPRILDERRCRVLVDGGRVVVPWSPPSAPADAESALRRLLQELLQVAHGNAPALSALAESAPKGTVALFVRELESALIPVNRAAATRALARVARESLRARAGDTKRAVLPPLSPPAIKLNAQDLDENLLDVEGDSDPSASDPFGYENETMPRGIFSEVPVAPATPSEIDELLLRAVASTPPPPPRDFSAGGSNFPARRSSTPAARGVDELLASFGVGETRPEDLVAWGRVVARPKISARPLPAPVPPPVEPVASHALPEPEAEPQLPVSRTAATRRLRRVSSPSAPPMLEETTETRKPARVLPMIALLLLAGILGGAIFLLRHKPGALTGRTPDVVEAERKTAAALAASVAARGPIVPCRATVVVSEVPQNGEVLVRSGVAPVDVERVPAGARLEFVAMNDGFVPRRAVVPQGAAWESAAGKPRFELAIQLERSRAKGAALDAWPAAEPGTTVGGTGTPGTVHVVTTPRGAEVWMVAGAGPETTISALPCGTSLELLVAGSAQGQPFRRRLRVDGAELSGEGSVNAPTARVSASP
jgi:hypothetical protein